MYILWLALDSATSNRICILHGYASAVNVKWTWVRYPVCALYRSGLRRSVFQPGERQRGLPKIFHFRNLTAAPLFEKRGFRRGTKSPARSVKLTRRTASRKCARLRTRYRIYLFVSCNRSINHRGNGKDWQTLI